MDISELQERLAGLEEAMLPGGTSRYSERIEALQGMTLHGLLATLQSLHTIVQMKTSKEPTGVVHLYSCC